MEDKKAILGELERGVGFLECNLLVTSLVREALAAQGKAALARLPAVERGPVALINLARMLRDQGKLQEAKPLFEEALKRRRETLGPRHPHTLASIGNLTDLLREMGRLAEAEAVLGDAVAAARETLGDKNHERTLVLQARAARLQHAQPGGGAAGKEQLAATVARMAEVLGEGHQQTSKYREALREME